jgi:hypothetical protein
MVGLYMGNKNTDNIEFLNNYVYVLLNDLFSSKEWGTLKDEREGTFMSVIADKLLIKAVYSNLYNEVPEDQWCTELHNDLLSRQAISFEQYEVVVKILYITFDRLYHRDASTYYCDSTYPTFYATTERQLIERVKQCFKGDITHIIQIELCNQRIPFSILASKLMTSSFICFNTMELLSSLFKVKDGLIDFSSLVRKGRLFDTDINNLLRICYNILLLKLDIHVLESLRLPYGGPGYERLHYVRFGPEFLIGLSGLEQNTIEALVKNIITFYKEEFDLDVTLKVTDVTGTSSIECFNYKLSYGFKQTKDLETVREVSFDRLELFFPMNSQN